MVVDRSTGFTRLCCCLCVGTLLSTEDEPSPFSWALCRVKPRTRVSLRLHIANGRRPALMYRATFKLSTSCLTRWSYVWHSFTWLGCDLAQYPSFYCAPLPRFPLAPNHPANSSTGH
ncbi:hypothetical protein FA13DRAFT_1043112 [Coprinellus micaceus]|uniref:Uncharacterized protein n=1 Tax=Coprinellus micaceus TaxID=71717 RepID=A0A4Y7RNZ7_COPMI|nr:hypothetical protein FA13DRAFT_1043112 [Coprinellus micaceus]